MLRPLTALLLICCAAYARSQEPSPFWFGLWTENASKSSIFFPGTLLIQAKPGSTYSVSVDRGKRRAAACAPASRLRQSCLYLTAAEPAGAEAGKQGIEYKLNAKGTELEVDHWRVVPDGTRLTDADFYKRAVPGKGYAGSWRKTRSTEAPTVYRVSRDGDRFTFAVPNGESTVTFAIIEAGTPQGAYASRDRENGNRYKLLGSSQILEESLSKGKVTARSIITLSADRKTSTYRL